MADDNNSGDSGRRGGNRGGGRPRNILNGGTIKDVALDVVMFFLMNSVLGAISSAPVESKIREAIGEHIGTDPSKSLDGASMDKVLNEAKKFVTSSMPEGDRRKVDDVFMQLWQGTFDVQHNNMDPAAKQAAISNLKRNANEKLREIKEARAASFQTRVFERLDTNGQADCLRFAASLTTDEEKARFAAIRDSIESPDIMRAALGIMPPGVTAAALVSADDAVRIPAQDKRKAVIFQALENLASKPKTATAKSVLHQVAEFIHAPELAKLFTHATGTLPPRNAGESDDAYRTRLIGLGAIKPGDDFAVKLQEDEHRRNHAAARASREARREARDKANIRYERNRRS